MDQNDAFMLGWLDALACAGAVDVSLQMPTHARKELLRRGWMGYRPLNPGEKIGKNGRATRITPLGWKTLSEWFNSSGLGGTYDVSIDPESRT